MQIRPRNYLSSDSSESSQSISWNAKRAFVYDYVSSKSLLAK